MDVPIVSLNSGGILYEDGSYVVSPGMSHNETLGRYASNGKIIRYLFVYIEDGESSTQNKTTQPTTTTILPKTSTSAPDIKNNAGFVICIGLSVLVIVIAFVIYVCQKELNEENHFHPCRKFEKKETENTTKFFETGSHAYYDNYSYSDGNPPSSSHSYHRKGEMYQDYGLSL